jgi:hypothetical protein
MLSAGRAYQCGSWNLYGCASDPRYTTTPVILRETAPGYYEAGSCQ